MKLKFLFIAFILPFLTLAQSAVSLPEENSLLAPDLLREDFNLLYEQLQQNHPRLYGYRTKADADKHFQEISSNINKPLDRKSFHRLIAPFISEFKDGHTLLNISFEDGDLLQYELDGGKFFPLEVIIIRNKLYAKSNPNNTGSIKKGDEILNINGHTVAELLPELRSLISSDGEANANANTQRLFGYNLWLRGIKGSEFEIVFKSEESVIQEKLSGISKEELLQLIFKGITPNTKLHLYPETSLAVVEINSYGNIPVTTKFIDSSFREIKSRGIKNVALDLRKNGGGNSAVGDYFLAHLTRKPYSVTKRKSWRFGPLVQQLDSTHYISRMRAKALKEYHREGEVWHSPDQEPLPANVTLKDSSLFQPLNFYLLTSARTYSSAHMTAMAVKCGNLGVIIGQPTGERLNLTGETLAYKMPNSGLVVYIPVASYTTACGDGDIIGVPPDHEISYTVEDLREERDPEVNFLLELLKKKSNL